MSRLIDADALLKEFNPDGEAIDQIYARIKIVTKPTAYDPDKVVEQLEDYLFEKHCVEGDTKIEEIVKGGGVNEQSITDSVQYRHGSGDSGRQKDSDKAISKIA